MPLVVKDRVRSSTTTTGTGTLTLGAAAAGFQDFSVIGNGNTTYYTITDTTNNTWEVGIGTYTASGTTLSRDTVLDSSNAGSLVNFAAGSKDVFVTYPASYSFGTAQVLPATSGGTGQSSYAVGDILYASTTTALSKLPGVATGNALLSGGVGVAPAWGKVGLTTHVSGTLPVANGGTGATSLAGASIATYTGTETLTNKRVDPRTITTTSTATLTPDISVDDQFNITAQAVSLTVAAPIGTPVDGNKIILRILDNGTSRTITWNATYTAIGVALPTATTAGKMLYVGCIYNATNTRWDVVALAQQA